MSEFKLNLVGTNRKGIKFNPYEKTELTYGECLDPISQITDDQELREYFNDYVSWQANRCDLTLDEAKTVCEINVGYYLGYGSVEQRLRVERVLGVEHPMLGSAREKQDFTFDELMELGRKRAEEHLKGGDSNSA
jgi:hypothetical protein